MSSGSIALGLRPGLDLPLRFVLAEAVTRLQAFDQFVAAAPDACEILVGELTQLPRTPALNCIQLP